MDNTTVNSPQNALPDIPRPVFLSYSRRDFRIAYTLWEMMLDPKNSDSHDTQVLMDFSILIPPDMKLAGIQMTVSTEAHLLGFGRGYVDGWAKDMPGWMYGIGKNMLASQSMLVLLTPNGERSEAIDTELRAFEAFPEKPLFFISVNGTPIPDRFAKYENAQVFDLKIDMESLLGTVLRAAFDAKDKEEWKDAGILFTEALQMMRLYPHPNAELTRDLLVNRGQADIILGYRDEAVSMYEQANQLADKESFVTRASILHNLGWAYATQDIREIGRSRDALREAVDRWEKALKLLDTDVPREQREKAEALRTSCRQAIERESAQISQDMTGLIPLLLEQAGHAERTGDWSLVRDLYERIYCIYRLSDKFDSPVVADMLSAKGRAERSAALWDDAKKTLKFALNTIDPEDKASRAGLLYDLGCSHCHNAHTNTENSTNIEQLWRTQSCWKEAESILSDLCELPVDNPRYSYSDLASLCNQANAWINIELSKLSGKEEQAMQEIWKDEMRQAGFTSFS